MESCTSTPTARPVVVATAAPVTPRRGKGPNPKIRHGSRTRLTAFAIHSTRMAMAASPAPRNTALTRKSVSTTPLQALFMMNDPFAHEQADKFAVRIALAVTDEAKRIDFAYRLAFGRPATREEIRAAKEFLKQCRQDLKDTKIPAEQQPRAALASFCRVLLGSNEFMFVD